MELNKCSVIAQEKLTLIRRELQEVVVLTSTLTTQLEIMLTSKDDLLINSFGINGIDDISYLFKSSTYSHDTSRCKVSNKKGCQNTNV